MKNQKNKLRANARKMETFYAVYGVEGEKFQRKSLGWFTREMGFWAWLYRREKRRRTNKIPKIKDYTM